MTLQEARDHIGSGVVYTPHGPNPHREDGVIHRVNDSWVFVLYVGDRTPKATAPDRLCFLYEDMEANRR